MPEVHEYDVVVIGAGSTGENVAGRAVRGGLSAAVVEAGLVGGECSYYACMPSKALLRPGQALSDARAVGGAAAAVTGRLDPVGAFARRDGFTHSWDDAGQVAWVDDTGIALHRGQGRLAGPRVVEVATPEGPVTLRARHAVALAVGSEPALPPVPGLDEVRPWTTREATSASSVPPRLLVVGGGVAGCELAQAYAALGASVVLVAREPRLLARFEAFAGELVAAAMARQGIDVRTGTELTAARRERSGTVVASVGDERIEADELLVATGRRPRTGDVGLEQVGLEPGAVLAVDDTLAVAGVAGGWLYAAGDCNGRALLTHQGKYQARICGDAIVARARGATPSAAPWSEHRATADLVAVPQVVFTEPEVASVGRSEAVARHEGLRVRVVDYDLGALAGASLYADGYEGRARLVVDEDRRVVVGATFVGRAVAELLHSATVAVVGEVPLERLWHAVPGYPTISEVWLRLLEGYGL